MTPKNAGPALIGDPDFDSKAALRVLSAADPFLARLIERVGPFRMALKSASSLFDVLAEAIVYQQLHARCVEHLLTRARTLAANAWQRGGSRIDRPR